MKIKFIPKLALLIYCASTVACTLNPTKKEPEKKGVEYNSYTEQIVENHLLVREIVRDMSQDAQNLTDSAYQEKMYKLMITVDSISIAYSLDSMQTREDSLAIALGNRLYANYFKAITQDLNIINQLVNDGNNQSKIDSIRNDYLLEDSIARHQFNLNMDSIYRLNEPLK